MIYIYIYSFIGHTFRKGNISVLNNTKLVNLFYFLHKGDVKIEFFLKYKVLSGFILI